MPADNQKGRLPRSSTPGRPLIWKFAEGTLGIQYASQQDLNYDTYVEPNNDRLLRRLAMPSVIRLLYDRTEYDSDPPAGFQYSGVSYTVNPDFDVYAASIAAGCEPPSTPPPYGVENPPPIATIQFQDFTALYDLDTLGFVFWFGTGTPPRVPAYVDLGLPGSEDIVSGDPNPSITEPPPNIPVKFSYVRVTIQGNQGGDPKVYYYNSCQGADGDSLIGTPFNGPPY
jgi:hypothetical protein